MSLLIATDLNITGYMLNFKFQFWQLESLDSAFYKGKKL